MPGARAAGAGRTADPQQRRRGPSAIYDIDAPGANDDGSGTVLSMELARVFAESGIEFDATLVFMTVAGEEQGLIGSGAHAKKAQDEKIPIQAWFNNDIVGNSHGGDGSTDGATIRIYSEGPEDSPSRSLAQFTARVGAAYVPSHRIRLMARRDRFSRGGDHSALNAAGFRRDRVSRGARELREAARRRRHHRRRGLSLSGAERPRERGGMATLALAPPPPAS